MKQKDKFTEDSKPFLENSNSFNFKRFMRKKKEFLVNLAFFISH